MKKENGVTLIALVITIIVLLILAGISIAMLSGDNGILSNASKAGVETKIGNAKENVVLTINELTTEYYGKKYGSNTTDATAVASQTLGDYIDANVATKLDTSLVTYASGKFTIITKDAEGKTLTATYDKTANGGTGSIGVWTQEANPAS